jgi:hypothetical protein
MMRIQMTDNMPQLFVICILYFVISRQARPFWLRLAALCNFVAKILIYSPYITKELQKKGEEYLFDLIKSNFAFRNASSLLKFSSNKYL